jgi:CBS domain-containing protein
MILYKFFKPNCYPCKTVTAILKRIEIPEYIKVIEIDASLEENKALLEEYKIEKVPVLQFENGRRLDGMKPLIITEKFIKGE